MEGGKVSLNRDQLWVDMWKFEEELQRPHDPEANRIERIRGLRRLYQGHFLQHEAETPWVLRARQALRDGLLDAIRDAARACEHACRWKDAANLYRSGIELDSLNEGLHRGLMLCHREIGNHSEALLTVWLFLALGTTKSRSFRSAGSTEYSVAVRRQGVSRWRGEASQLGRVRHSMRPRMRGVYLSSR
jgi:hypothetical protein